MAAILRDSAVVVAVVRTRPRAIPLTMINLSVSFSFLYENGAPLTMCSSDFVFRKYKQDNAFRVSGVLQLAKTGPLVTKNFSFLRLFLSSAMMAWRFYTPYDVNRTNLHILAPIGHLWSSRKKSCALVRSPNLKITSQRIIDFNILE